MKTILSVVVAALFVSGCATSGSSVPVKKEIRGGYCAPDRPGRRCAYADDQSIDLLRRQLEKNP